MENKHVCLRCGVNSEERVLISCEYQSEERWVCVSCLPILIHGSHA